MPRVYMCPLCKKKVLDTDDWVASSVGDRVHLECNQNRPKAPKPAAAMGSIRRNW